MGLNIYREKLLNATLFFAKETQYLNLTKICKLLNYLDFEHFRETGYPSIGLKYYAFPQGSVPKDFWAEIKDANVPSDFEGKLSLSLKINEYTESKEVEIKALTEPDLTVFSPREKDILNELASKFKYYSARGMSEISHQDNDPWDITIKETGANGVIDYLLALDEKCKLALGKDPQVDKEEAEESLKEYFEFMKNFSIEPTGK